MFISAEGLVNWNASDFNTTDVTRPPHRQACQIGKLRAAFKLASGILSASLKTTGARFPPPVVWRDTRLVKSAYLKTPKTKYTV